MISLMLQLASRARRAWDGDVPIYRVCPGAAIWPRTIVGGASDVEPLMTTRSPVSNERRTAVHCSRFSSRSPPQGKPYIWGHLRFTLYALAKQAEALGRTRDLAVISRDLDISSCRQDSGRSRRSRWLFKECRFFPQEPLLLEILKSLEETCPGASNMYCTSYASVSYLAVHIPCRHMSQVHLCTPTEGRSYSSSSTSASSSLSSSSSSSSS